MTDLRKGIIEIEGVEISRQTSSVEIRKALSDRWFFHNVTPSGKSESFIFHNVRINNRNFSIKLYFYLESLTNIRLDFMNEDRFSFEQLFEKDCMWLKNLLGVPTFSGKCGVVYEFDKYQIGATYQPNDGRCGTDEFIDMIYERG